MIEQKKEQQEILDFLNNTFTIDEEGYIDLDIPEFKKHYDNFRHIPEFVAKHTGHYSFEVVETWLYDTTYYQTKITHDDGTKKYYQGINLHRKDAPAAYYSDGSKGWFIHGVCHREDGAAYEGNGTNTDDGYYINGKLITVEEFNDPSLDKTYVYPKQKVIWNHGRPTEPFQPILPVKVSDQGNIRFDEDRTTDELNAWMEQQEKEKQEREARYQEAVNNGTAGDDDLPF